MRHHRVLPFDLHELHASPLLMRLFGLALSLFASVLGASELPVPSHSAAAEIRFESVLANTLEVAGEVFLVPSGPAQLGVVRRALDGSKPLQLDLPAGTTWEVAAEVPGFWVQRQSLEVPVDGAPAVVTLRLWPLGHVEGTLRMADVQEKLPASVQLQTVPVPAFLGRPPLPAGAFDCLVDEKGRFRCTLPAATFDLVVIAPGFVPHYFWQTPVPPTKARPLGSLRLERGASLAGWVTAELGKIDPTTTRVRLTPAADCSATTQSRFEASRRTISAPVNAEGFFQFRGLAPGAYVVEASQQGFSPASAPPILVDAGREARLPLPLALQRPWELEVRISPPLDPEARPWSLHVARQNVTGSPTTDVFEAELGLDGRAVMPARGPGSYNAIVLDADGQRWVSRYGWEVNGPAEGLLEIEIEAVKLKGRLELGDEPVTGELWFGGRRGTERLRFQGNAEGVFEGVLPRAGRWWLEIESAAPVLSQSRWVEVVANGEGVAELEVRLPNTKVSGQVLDLDGQPAAGATVYALGADPPQQARADSEGRFELLGAEAGSVALVAERRGRSSRRLDLVLREDEPAGPVELKLEPTRAVRGRVQSPSGAVAGASLVALSLAAAEGGATAVSDPEGAFTLELGSQIRTFALVARAPGLGTDVLTVERGDEDAPLSVSLRPEQGTLTVEIRGLEGRSLPLGQALQIAKDGVAVAPALLAPQGAREEVLSPGTGRLSFLGLASGAFQACLVPSGLTSTTAADSRQPGAHCDRGFLGAGGELVLRLEVGG